MTAAATSLRDAWSALRAFLRGFVGVPGDGDASLACHSPHDNHHDEHRNARAGEPTAASARAALAARAARRPNCC